MFSFVDDVLELNIKKIIAIVQPVKFFREYNACAFKLKI